MVALDMLPMNTAVSFTCTSLPRNMLPTEVNEHLTPAHRDAFWFQDSEFTFQPGNAFVVIWIACLLLV